MKETNKQFAVIGLGRLGTAIVETLSKHNCDVLAIDINKECVDRVSEVATRAIIADATDVNVLTSLGIDNFDVVVVAIGENIEMSIMTTVLLKDLGVKYIVAKAKNKIHEEILTKLGVDKVILPEAEMGMRVATNLINKHILDYIEFSTDYSILELEVKQEWIGKSLITLNLRTKENINVIAIKKTTENGGINVSPKPEYVIKEDDILIGIVSNDTNI